MREENPRVHTCPGRRRASRPPRWTNVRRKGLLSGMSTTQTAAVNQLNHLDEELEVILTSFDSSYAWNYGNLKAGLRELYEKAKREQWNGTEQLAWDTDVDPEEGILPDFVNPLVGYGPYEKLNDNHNAVRFLREAIRPAHDVWVRRQLYRIMSLDVCQLVNQQVTQLL